MNFPFSDQSMVYDYTTHRYTLTKECVFNELGINLDVRLNTALNDNPSNAADIALKQVSRRVYNFIYSRCGNKLYIELLLAKYEPCRNVLKECMLNEVRYFLANGNLGEYSGVNLANNSAMELSPLRDSRIVSQDTEATLYQPLPNGVCLLYQGRYIVPYFILYQGY